MKTAVYIPDDIFTIAEKVARRLKLSRSQLYAKAVKEYIHGLESNNITEKLNAIYSDNTNESKMDKEIHKAQLDILEKEDW
ncbi:MAG: hypothetical protein KAW12_27690 [Candidatus Aminicenantes bacterium]|nr:hypothetical protein [Candidatus Aminicenantes bacterium]